MKLCLFLTSIAFSIMTMAQSTITLDAHDFSSASKISRDGKTLISAKLSESGQMKFKNLNDTAVDKEIHSDIGGVSSNMRLREAIRGGNLQMGPYSASDAHKVVNTINQQ